MLDAIDAIEARLRVILGGFTPPLEAPTFAFGETELTVQDAPPRITWVPRQGPIRAPNGLGGDGVKQPRPLRSRNLTWEVHVWAAAPSVDGSGGGAREDFVACEQLCDHLANAINDVMPGQWDVTGEGWLTAASESNKNGIVCVLAVVLRTPFTREPEKFSLPITDFPITPVIDTTS